MNESTRNVDGLEIPVGRPGLPDDAYCQRMNRATDVVRAVMEPHGGHVTHSPLGAGWSSDIDVYFASGRSAAMAAARDAGWVSLDDILGRLGYPGRGRWAVVESGQVLAKADIEAGAVPDPIRALQARIERRHGVTLREALEIRHLARSNSPDSIADRATLAAAAAVEADLGGNELSEWRETNEAEPQSTRLPSRRSFPRFGRSLRPRLRVALSGVDGAGKSSLVDGLGEIFDVCGLTWSVVWTRPGMRLRLLEGLAGVAKKLLRVTDDGLADLASGTSPKEVRSRRGVLGWVWSVLVTFAYTWDVWRRTLSAKGNVVIYDRHHLDAVATTEAFYDGVDTRFQLWLIRRLVPRADATIWLDVPADIAAVRKPDDVFNQRMIRLQIDRYQANADSFDTLIRIDGTESPRSVVLTAFRSISDALAGQKPSRWTTLVSWVRSR